MLVAVHDYIDQNLHQWELHLIVKIIPAQPDKGDQRGREIEVSDALEHSQADPSREGGGGCKEVGQSGGGGALGDQRGRGQF